MIHYFNPGHETAVLNTSPYYTPPANIMTMQRELSFLPAWYASSGDVVYQDDVIDRDYLFYLQRNIDFKLHTINKSNISEYNGCDVCLWGISPQSIHFFQEINNNLDVNLQIPKWNDIYLYLNSREAAKDCLSDLIKLHSQISERILPDFYSTLEQIEERVTMSSFQLLAKAPFSSSGRGLLWLPVDGLTRTERQILHGFLKKQKKISLEPVLDKQVDFAMEFISNGKGRVDFVGYSLFETTSRGNYLGNYIGSQAYIEKILIQKVQQSLLDDVRNSLISILSQKYGNLYNGCIGVDMMIYSDNGKFKLHPCLEINMRYNMGYLAYMLTNNYICSDSQGRFVIDFSPIEGNIYRQHEEMKQKYTPLFADNKLLSGYLSLCPINEKTHYRAYVLVNR